MDLHILLRKLDSINMQIKNDSTSTHPNCPVKQCSVAAFPLPRGLDLGMAS